MAAPLSPDMTGKCGPDLSVIIQKEGLHVLKYKKKKCSFEITSKRYRERGVTQNATLYFAIKSCDGKNVLPDTDISPLRHTGFIKVDAKLNQSSGVLRVIEGAQPVACNFQVSDLQFMRDN